MQLPSKQAIFLVHQNNFSAAATAAVAAVLGVRVSVIRFRHLACNTFVACQGHLALEAGPGIGSQSIHLEETLAAVWPTIGQALRFL